MRAFYITGIALSVILMIVTGIYEDEVRDARWSYYDYDYSYNSYGADNRYDIEYTTEAGLITAFFFLFFIALEILTFIKLKTVTMKVLTIIGISLSGILLLWDFAMITSPSHISFDEVAPAWGLFGFTQLGFCIVGTAHAFRKKV